MSSLFRPPSTRPDFLVFSKDTLLLDLVKKLGLKSQKGDVNDLIVFIKQDLCPPIVGVDINLEDNLKQLMELVPPSTKVIVFGSKNDIAYYKYLMGLGISEYIPKPLTRDILLNALASLSDEKASTKDHNGQIIAFTATKPSLGAPHLAFLTAYSLSYVHHKQVLLMDLDPYASPFSLWAHKQIQAEMPFFLDPDLEFDLQRFEKASCNLNPKCTILTGLTPLDQDYGLDSRHLTQFLASAQTRNHFVLIHIPLFLSPILLHLKDLCSKMFCLTDYSMQSLREVRRMTTYLPNLSMIANLLGAHEVPEDVFHEKVSYTIKDKIQLDTFQVEESIWNQSVDVSKSVTQIVNGIDASKVNRHVSKFSFFSFGKHAS